LAAAGSLWAAQESLPDGPGKSALESVCTKCHDLSTATAKRRTAVEWGLILDKMVTQGAIATDSELDEILDYLVRNFSKPINVNRAAAKELQAELGFSPEEAEAIVAYRERNGDFKSLDEMKKVPGLDAKKLDALKDRIAFL
jgi:competence protein ComEA